MKTVFKLLIVLTLILQMASCRDDSVFAGFKKMDSGAYMKFYSHGDSKVMPRLDDEVTFEMAQYFNDTMLFTTVGDKPMSMVLKKADFVGDVSDALLMMHVGDSARLIVLSDSVFLTMMDMDVPEEFAGKPIFYDLKLLSVKPLEVLMAERKAHADSSRIAELGFLASLRDDPKNVVTESGIIILDKKGKDKFPHLGDYVNFHFTMLKPSGDTIMSSFKSDPIEMQYGEEFFCDGFNKALGMVPVDGMLRFVIPSSMAFDSVGYEKYIDPYTPLVVYCEMNKVIDKETYEKEQAILKANKEAERERMLRTENELMDKWIKDHNVTENPTESGLYIIRKKEGSGELARIGDRVSIQYVLINMQGDTLESSYDGIRPMSFKIGNGDMIPAIEEALMTMTPGTKVSLLTPSDLAFGDVVIDEVWLPAYTPLQIDLELVSINNR